MNQEEGPAAEDLREIEVLRFLFDIKREQIDPMRLQQMLLEHQIQNQLKQLAFGPPSPGLPPLPAPPVPSMFSPQIDYNMIPEPKVIFNYAPSAKYFPPTPEPDQEQPIDYTTSGSKTTGKIPKPKKRSQFIELKEGGEAAGSRLTPSKSPQDSDSDENTADTRLKELNLSEKVEVCRGFSVYHNLPLLVMSEYDKILKDSHTLKVDVIKEMNRENPVNYEYNPKKSRIRTNYNDPQIADDRTKNNIASRRSRQRKKFQVQVVQYSVDYDLDENFLLGKQEQWLRSIVENLENKVLSNDESEGAAKLKQLRQQCGFE